MIYQFGFGPLLGLAMCDSICTLFMIMHVCTKITVYQDDSTARLTYFFFRLQMYVYVYYMYAFLLQRKSVYI